MKYELDIAGRKYEFLQLRFRREASLEAQIFKGTLIIAGGTLPNFSEAITVKRELLNTKLTKWQGKVNQVRYIPGQNRVIEVLGYDLARKINYLKVPTLGYSNTKGSTIFVDNRDPQATTDLIAGTIDTSDPPLDSVDFGKTRTGQTDSAFTRRMAFDLIQMISNRDIYIERTGNAHFNAGAGVDRSATFIFEHGLNGSLAPDTGYVEDETRRVKGVTVKGKGVGDIFFSGSAGTPVSTDKVRHYELPFLVTKDTCDKAAANILTELNKTVKYAIFELTDLFGETWDVFDTVKLKARLPNKTVNENLKVFSIETVVSSIGEQYESVTVELLNFTRAIWAKLIDPLKADENEQDRIGLSIGATQLQQHIGNAGGSSIITSVETVGFEVGNVDDTAFVNIDSRTFSATKTAGLHVEVTLKITSKITNIVTVPVVLVELTDGVVTLINGVSYEPTVGVVTRNSTHFFIPKDTSGLTFSVKAKVGHAGGRIDLDAMLTWYSIGEHIH